MRAVKNYSLIRGSLCLESPMLMRSAERRMLIDLSCKQAMWTNPSWNENVWERTSLRSELGEVEQKYQKRRGSSSRKADQEQPPSRQVLSLVFPASFCCVKVPAPAPPSSSTWPDLCPDMCSGQPRGVVQWPQLGIHGEGGDVALPHAVHAPAPPAATVLKGCVLPAAAQRLCNES